MAQCMMDLVQVGIYYLNHATTFQVLNIKKLDFKMYEKV